MNVPQPNLKSSTKLLIFDPYLKRWCQQTYQEEATLQKAYQSSLECTSTLFELYANLTEIRYLA